MDARKKRIRRVRRLAERTTPLQENLTHQRTGAGQRTAHDLPSYRGGNSAEYLVARIARDRPDILEKMRRGDYEYVRRAAIEAGIVTPRERRA